MQGTQWAIRQVMDAQIFLVVSCEIRTLSTLIMKRSVENMGEIFAVAKVIGDDTAFYHAWVDAGDIKSAEAEEALATGSVPANSSCGPLACMQPVTTPCSAHQWTRACWWYLING